MVDEIIDPGEEEHPVEDFREYEPYEEGNKSIILESDSTSELGNQLFY